jgi:hypothetical protein
MLPIPRTVVTARVMRAATMRQRVFDSSSGVDDDWEEILDIIADRTRHIHARVGYAQGPQVPVSFNAWIQPPPAFLPSEPSDGLGGVASLGSVCASRILRRRSTSRS